MTWGLRCTRLIQHPIIPGMICECSFFLSCRMGIILSGGVILRFIVVGDTHGQIQPVLEELKNMPADGLFFTGDHYLDGLKIARELALDFYGVTGNCDRGVTGPHELTLEFLNNRIYLCHGHLYGVKNTLQNLYYRSLEVGAGAVVFGHTHSPFCEQIDGIWFINPGSPTRPRFNSPKTYILLELEDLSIKAGIIEINN